MGGRWEEGFLHAAFIDQFNHAMHDLKRTVTQHSLESHLTVPGDVLVLEVSGGEEPQENHRLSQYSAYAPCRWPAVYRQDPQLVRDVLHTMEASKRAAPPNRPQPTARCTLRTTIGGLPPPLERSNTIRMFIIKQEYVFGTIGSDKMVVQFIVCVD